jgi:hypothetical protein
MSHSPLADPIAMMNPVMDSAPDLLPTGFMERTREATAPLHFDPTSNSTPSECLPLPSSLPEQSQQFDSIIIEQPRRASNLPQSLTILSDDETSGRPDDQVATVQQQESGLLDEGVLSPACSVIIHDDVVVAAWETSGTTSHRGSIEGGSDNGMNFNMG